MFRRITMILLTPASILLTLLLVGLVALTASAQLWSDDFSGRMSAEWGVHDDVIYDVAGGQMVATGTSVWGYGNVVRGDRGVAIGETLMTDLISVSRSTGHARARLAAFDDTTGENRIGCNRRSSVQ